MSFGTIGLPRFSRKATVSAVWIVPAVVHSRRVSRAACSDISGGSVKSECRLSTLAGFRPTEGYLWLWIAANYGRAEAASPGRSSVCFGLRGDGDLVLIECSLSACSFGERGGER